MPLMSLLIDWRQLWEELELENRLLETIQFKMEKSRKKHSIELLGNKIKPFHRWITEYLEVDRKEFVNI
jgi:hypothetical protein